MLRRFRQQTGGQRYGSALPGKINADGYIRRWQHTCSSIRPFKQGNGLTVQQVPNADILQLLGIFHSVKIEVMDLGPRRLMGFQQGVGRTCDISLVTQSTQNAADEGSLACTKIALKMDDSTSGNVRRQPDSQIIHCRFAGYFYCQRQVLYVLLRIRLQPIAAGCGPSDSNIPASRYPSALPYPNHASST